MSFFSTKFLENLIELTTKEAFEYETKLKNECIFILFYLLK